MSLLLLSLVALLLGPLVLRFVRGKDSVLSVLDGFIYVAIGGVVLFHVLPPLVDRVGLWVFAAAALGLLGPTYVERWVEKSGHGAHRFALALACVALACHGFFDGVALSGGTRDKALQSMGLAVLLHRLPVGLTIWWLVQPIWGRGAAAASLALIGLTTVLGWIVGAPAIENISSPIMAFCYATVAGSLLHVLMHCPGWGKKGAQGVLPRYGAGFGGLLGIGLLWYLHQVDSSSSPSGHPHEHADGGFVTDFLHLSLESAPALLLAYIAAGFIQAWLPKSSILWMRKGGAMSQAGRGVAFGLPLPICSCGVIPVYRSLILQGAPPTAAMAFLVATPELGIDAVLLSLPLLGADMTVARVVCAGLVALGVGVFVGKSVSRSENSRQDTGSSQNLFKRPEGFVPRLRLAARSGLVEIVDHTAPWILVGLFIAAGLAPNLEGSWIQAIPDGWDVIVFALLGLPVYVCASGATPLVAVLLAAEVSAGAGLAFLLSGPATNVTTFGILSALHGRAAALRFGVVIVSSCVALGIVVNLFWPEIGGGGLPVGLDHDATLLQWVSLFGLVLLCLGSLVREGPRGFFGQVFSQFGDDCDDDCDSTGHSHGPGGGDFCGHDHGHGHSHSHD